MPGPEDAGAGDAGFGFDAGLDAGAPDAGSPPPTCNDLMANGAETDVDCGGAICVRCADGERCLVPADCFSGLCAGGRCSATPTCADGLANGAESDVDCGGPICVRCADGRSCTRPADCFSGSCAGARCVPQPTCADGARNGQETDVDCGGPICPRCPIGRGCLVAADCTSSHCTGMTCAAQPSCTDNAKNGLESDVDCGGPFCPPCNANRLCYVNGDCDSNVCSDALLQSDATWRQLLFAPSGWEQPGFNDSSWSPAFVQEPHGASAVWGTSPPMPPMSKAGWIWYRDSRQVGDSSTVYFRKSFVGPPSAVTMHLSVDDAFTAYLNGVPVATGFLWYNTVVTPLTTVPGAPYVLAVRAQNNTGPGGLVADVRTAEKTCLPHPDAGVSGPDGGVDGGADAGFDGGMAGGDAGLRVALPALERAMLDEELPNRVTNTRLHVRDDGKACGGAGAVRSIAKWDVSQVPCVDVASVNVRWVYAHAFNQYFGPPRQVSVHQVQGAWSGATATWANAPLVDSVPLATVTLSDAPDASIVVPVRLDAGIDGLQLRFVSETCPAPRWPAELDPRPTLEVQCR